MFLNSNIKAQMPSQIQNTKPKVYDLKDRTSTLGKSVIKIAKIIPANYITRPLISQLIRASTSIGANYMEADGAESKKDFKHKIALVKKEAKETMRWLEMLKTASPEQENELRNLWKEAHELTLIFSSILRK